MAHVCQEFAFDLVHFVKLEIQLRLFVDFTIKIFVDAAQFGLRIQEVTHHAVKRFRKTLEFVAGEQLGPCFHLTPANFIGDILQVLKRFHDDVAHNQPTCHDREHGRYDRHGNKNRSIACDRRFGLFVIKLDTEKRQRSLVARVEFDLFEFFGARAGFDRRQNLNIGSG